MSEITNLRDVIVNYPIILSLTIYVIICIIIYVKKPKSIFQEQSEESEEENEENEENKHIFKKNINVIFIIMPFIIYGVVCGISSTMIRTSYCDILKQKEGTIKELLKQCKS
jgi:flagellar biosynthesis protein FlhB